MGDSRCNASIANENYRDFVLYWAYEQIDANVNAVEFDEMSGGYLFASDADSENNENTGYDDYAIGTASFANKLSVVCGHGMTDPIDWFMPDAQASSETDSAKFAFDDDTATHWKSVAADSHWIEIDFGRARTVQQICLDFHLEYILRDFHIKYWNGMSWMDFSPSISVVANTELARSFLLEPVATSKVRLISADSVIYLPEFQILGQGFRQFLLKKYCTDSGWTVTDSRWETRKLVDFADSNQCPDGTMNSFNYREYLQYHGWTLNPAGSTGWPPTNPLFLDWFPLLYARMLVLYYLADSSTVDVVENMYSESYSYQRLYLTFWKSVCDSVRGYAAQQGKEIYITCNGSAFFPHYVDYIMRPMGDADVFPVYPAPSASDSNKTHLDGTQAQINLWRLQKGRTLSYLGRDVPFVPFCDFWQLGFPFAHIGGIDEPADERAIYLKTYAMEMYAVGVNFCFPVLEAEEDAWADSTSDSTTLIEIIKQQADFLNAYKKIYRNVAMNRVEDKVTVNGIVPFNGEWIWEGNRIISPVNDSKVTISYMDAQDELYSYLHVINHDWDSTSHRMIRQSNVPVEIPVRDSCIMVRVVSPDLPREDTLPFTCQDSVVRCIIPELDYYDVLILDLFSSGVEEDVNTREAFLYQGCPNPFVSSTSIRYSVAKAGHIELKIYNLAGQLAKTLVDEPQKAGTHSRNWNSRNNKGKIMPSGMYFVRLEAGDGLPKVKKLLLLR
jgi:hypothetical protein